MLKNPINIFIILCSWLIILNAGNPETAGFQFLNTVYSPRLKALGGSTPTLISDVGGIFGNPAGTAFIRKTQFTLNYLNYLLDLRGGYLGFAQPLRNVGCLSLGIIYFDYGKIEEVNQYAIRTGREFESREIALAASFANRLGDHFSYGINLKYAYSTIDVYSAAAMAADVGLLIRLPYLNLGFSLKNFGENIEPYEHMKEELPTNFTIGLSNKLLNSPVTLHASMTNLFPGNSVQGEYFDNYAFGLEYSLQNSFVFRLGYNNHLSKSLASLNVSNFAGFTAGFGLSLGQNNFDYSYGDYGSLGMTHHFGFTFKLGKKDENSVGETENGLSQIDTRLQPREVKAKIVNGKLLIYWRRVKGAVYNVYARYNDKKEWVRLNRQILPANKNFIIFQKPKIRGTYSIRVASIINSRLTMFSDEIKVSI